MMKKTFLTVAFVSSMGLLTACSETPYAPPVGQQQINPNMYPANNMLPNQQFPNQQFPNQQFPMQPLPGQVLPAPGATANGQFQFMLSNYRTQSCFPVFQTRSSYQCGIVVSSTPCKVYYVRRKVRVHSCNCIQVVTVAVSEAEYLALQGKDADGREVVTTTGTTKSPTLFKLSDPNEGRVATTDNAGSTRTDNGSANTGSGPDTKKPDGTTDGSANNGSTTNAGTTDPKPGDVLADGTRIINPVSTRARGELPVEEFYEVEIHGKAAHAIYDRLEIAKDKKREHVRKGPNIECDIDDKKLILTPNDAYNCKVSVQLIKNNGILIGELRAKANPEDVKKAEAKTSTDKPYPEIATHRDSVMMKAGKADIQIFFPAITSEINWRNPGNIMVELDLPEKDGFLDDAQTIRIKYKQSKSLKCYRTINMDKNVTECFIQINVKTGTASEIPAT